MKNRLIYKLIVILSLLEASEFYIAAQPVLLNLPVSLNIYNESKALALDSLSKKCQLSFSYNPDALNISQKITINAKKQPLIWVLKKIFADSLVQFTEFNRQIVIHKRISESLVQTETDNSIKKIEGQVFDKTSGNPLAFASLGFIYNGKGTITNEEGNFVINNVTNINNDTLLCSFIGYRSVKLAQSDMHNRVVKIGLETELTNLPQVVIRVNEPRQLILQALSKISQNYANQPTIYSAYFREISQQNDQYIDINEALIDLYKASYTNLYDRDQARIFKSRKKTNVQAIEAMQYKFEGGIYNTLQIDLIKNRPSFIDSEFFEFYNYQMLPPVSLNNRLMYVIGFEQKNTIPYPLYSGVIYLDAETLSLTGADFSISRQGLKYAQAALVKQKPRRVSVKPEKAEYQVRYSLQNNRYTLHFIRGSIDFRAKAKKSWFNSTYSTKFELVVTGQNISTKTKFKRSETVKPLDILSEQITIPDSAFWEHYDIIKPEEPLEEALKKLHNKH